MDITNHEIGSAIKYLVETDEFKPAYFTTLTYKSHIRDRGHHHWCRWLRGVAEQSQTHIKVWAARGSDNHLHLIISTKPDGEVAKSIQLPEWEYGGSLTKPYHDGVADYLFNKHGHDSVWLEEQGKGRVFCPKLTGCKRRCVYWD